MDNLEWKTFKKALGFPKLLKSGLPEVLIDAYGGSMRLMSSEKRRVLITLVDNLGINIHPGIQYSIPYDHPLFGETDVDSWTVDVKKDGMKFCLQSNVGYKTTDIRKKSKPHGFDVSEEWDLVADTKKEDFLNVLDHLEASASVKDTKTEEDARINAVYFRPSFSFSINRHTASVAPAVALKTFSIPSLDYSVIRSFVDKLDNNENVKIYQSPSYMKIGQDRYWLYLTRIASREPNFSRLEDNFSFKFTTSVSALKSLVKWSEYNAEASSYMTLHMENDQCEFKTKFKSLGSIKGKIHGEPFSVNLPSKGFVSLIEYLYGEEVNLNYSHVKMPTIFNLSTNIDGASSSQDHYIQSVRL